LLRLGVQVSSAGKIYYSIDRALHLGCNTMQIFTRNPRQFRKGSLKKEDIEIFCKKIKESDLSPLVVHTPYTLNLATPKKFLHWITVKEFIQDMIEVDKIGADYIVTHTGCYKGTTEEKGLKIVVRGLKKILKKTEGVKTKILLENTAGSGTWLGYTFSHYNFILKELNFSERIGLCVDTAHAWCAGYSINTQEGIKNLLDEIKREVGIERICVIHLNDTREAFGSKKDRHFHIGEGCIGEEGFSLIINHPLLKDIPFILETPKKSEEDDVKNLNTVRRLYYNEVYKRD